MLVLLLQGPQLSLAPLWMAALESMLMLVLANTVILPESVNWISEPEKRELVNE